MTIARLRYDRLRPRRRGVSGLLVFERQQSVYLAGIESCEAEIEIRFLNFLQFESEQLFVPIRLRHRTIHHERERLDLAGVHSSQRITGISVMPSLRAAFSRRWPSTTSPSLRTRQGILKPNSRIEAHIRSTAASFLPGVPWVLYKPFNRPNLDVLRRGLRVHALPSIKVILEDPSGGCALR